jgi:hypothetical protein
MEKQSWFGIPVTRDAGEVRDTLTIQQDGQMLVAIHSDGTVTHTPDYTPDAAARAFWDAVGANHPALATKAPDAD